MTPEEAHDRIADVLIDAGIWPHDCERVIAMLLRERQALLVAMGGKRIGSLATPGWLLSDQTDLDVGVTLGFDGRQAGWVVPDE